MNTKKAWYTLEVRGKEGSSNSPDTHTVEYVEIYGDNSYEVRQELFKRASELNSEGYIVSLYYNETSKTEIYTLD